MSLIIVLMAALAACSKSTPPPAPHETTGDPDLDRAHALRGQAKSGVPTWPAATKWLATDRMIEIAIDHGVELVVSDGNRLSRVPKDGTPPQLIAEVASDHKIVGVWATANSVLYKTFQRAEVGVHGDGMLWAIPFAGGKPGKVRDVEITDDVATLGPQLWLASGKQILTSKEPALAKLELVADKPHYTQGLAADARGVWWIEAEYDRSKHGDWINSPGKRIEVPLVFTVHTLFADGHRLLAIAGDSDPKTAPGGGTYYESKNAIYAIDEAGGVQALSAPIGEVWGYVIGGATLCAVDDGPKLDFGKSTTVLALALDGSKRSTTLASGLDHAAALAADSTSCYVTIHGKPGIAAVPLR